MTTTEISSELLPCPFCGFPVIPTRSGLSGNHDEGCFLRQVAVDTLSPKAVAAWNRRDRRAAGGEAVATSDYKRIYGKLAAEGGGTWATYMMIEIEQAYLHPSDSGVAVKALDPDMPADQIRLHMGEMTAQEIRTARAAIRWANSALHSSPDTGKSLKS